MRIQILASILTVMLLGLVHTAGAQQIDVIEPTGRWVTDRADLLTSSEEKTLEQKLAAYEDTTSTQIIIVTLPSLDGVPEADYATALGRAWGVGQQGQNNGVVILVSRDDRRAFIAPGYGLEGAIPDAIAGRIYRDILVPSFREGRFYEGLSATSDALIAAAAGEYVADSSGSGGQEGGGLDGATLFVLLIIAYFVISGLARSGGGGQGGGGRRRRSGPPVIIWGGGFGGGGGGFGGGGGGFGGFSGGGGSFGGGGAGGGW